MKNIFNVFDTTSYKNMQLIFKVWFVSGQQLMKYAII